MKKLTVLFAILLFVPACSVLEKVGLFAQENSILVDAATRQAVFRYIDAGATEADRAARAKGVADTIKRVDEYLLGRPTATTATLIAVVESEIRWDSLSRADKALVQDILGLVKLNLTAKQEEGLLDDEALIGIRALLRTALQAAMLL